MQTEIDLEPINEYGHQGLLMKFGDQHIVLDIDELDDLIETLGMIRNELAPAPDADVSRSKQYPVETLPEWFVHYDPSFDQLLLFLRHSGFGWTSFALSDACAQAMMKTMTPPSAGRGGGDVTRRMRRNAT